MTTTVRSIGELYARAEFLALSEGQAHHLALVLLRAPGAELVFDGVTVTIARAGVSPVAMAVATVPHRMPFDYSGSAYADDG